MTNKEAIEILEHNWTRLVNPDYTYIELGQAQDLAIKALEERPQGEWIEETDEQLKGMYRCSECGRRVDGSVLDDLLEVDEDYTIADIYPYCHCGADMRRREQ